MSIFKVLQGLGQKRFLWLSIQIIFLLSLILSPQTVLSDVREQVYPGDSDNIFWFIHISDLHIGTSRAPADAALWSIVNEIPEIVKPQYVVATGDLTESWTAFDRDGDWDEYWEIIRRNQDFLDIYYDIPGNHDRYGDFDWDGSGLKSGDSGYRYKSYRGALQRIYNPDDPVGMFYWTADSPLGNNYGSYMFLSANTCDESGKSLVWKAPFVPYYGELRISDIPELSSEELKYIEDSLQGFEEKENSKLAFIFGHHGLYNKSGPLFDWLPETIVWLPGLADCAQPFGPNGDEYCGVGGDGLQDIFKERPVAAYLYGHTHNNKEFFDSTVLQLNTGALEEGYYRIVAVDNNGLSTKTVNIKDTDPFDDIGIYPKWPVVLITAPIDKNIGGENLYANPVPMDEKNSIRALVFDNNETMQVDYRIGNIVDADKEEIEWDDDDWVPMVKVRSVNDENSCLWEAANWDTTRDYDPKNYKLQVRAISCGQADTNRDGIVDINEVLSSIARWKAGEISSEDNIEAIKKWKYGCDDHHIIEFKIESLCSPADTNRDGVVAIGELLTYIGDWKNGLITFEELDIATAEWKNGCPLDSDLDGLTDYLELTMGTDPNDADTDDDGLVDGNAGSEDLNANGTVDPGETDPLNPDTDGDGIYDGTEKGLTEPETVDTDLSAAFFIPDADSSTTTDPTNPDTDGDGIIDGNEDLNGDGAYNPQQGETDPGNSDSDGDGISDNEDSCQVSEQSQTVVIGDCDSLVINQVLSDGCTISDQIAECAASAKNHGKFVSCVAHLTNELKKDGLIIGKEKGAIQSCAAHSDIP